MENDRSNKTDDMITDTIRIFRIIVTIAIGSIFILYILTIHTTISINDANVTLGNYKDIKVSVPESDVTDDDINTYIDQMLSDYSLTVKSDKKIVTEGDMVQVTSYIRDENGDILDDGTNGTGIITVGSHETYEELEQGIIGADVGDELTIPIKFSDKDAICTIIINYICGNKITLETVTDEQAKELFGAESASKIKDTVRNQLEAQNNETVRDTAYETISEYLLNTCTIDPFPEDELQKRMDEYMANAEDMCNSYYGMSLDQYYAVIGTTKNQYEADIKTSITNAIKLELILQAIGKQENITLDDAGYQEYVLQLTNTLNCNSEEELYDIYSREYLEDSYLIEQVIDFLIDNAKIDYIQQKNNQ